jgi:hypothetical protein
MTAATTDTEPKRPVDDPAADSAAELRAALRKVADDPKADERLRVWILALIRGDPDSQTTTVY